MSKGVFGKALLVGLALSGFAMVPRPAAALDDGKGNSLLDVLDFVGLGEKKEQETIFYRERAPLVLPPKNELRQPMPAAADRVANWPKDPEAVRAAKKAEENRKRSAASDREDSGLAGKLTRQGRVSAADASQPVGPGGPCSMTPGDPNVCEPGTYWKNLSITTETPDNKKTVLQAGVEPERDFLTSPPKGYMAPTRTVEAKSEPARSEQEGIFDYFRKGGQ